ncbi:unnamed protein product [Ixodes hexagonus]
MLSQKGPACSAAEQAAYLVSWFGEYSELQRDDFQRVLARKYVHNAGLSGLLDELSLGQQRAPSLFQCRMTLFEEWFQGWSDEDKAAFLERLRAMDPEFVERIADVPSSAASNGVPYENHHASVVKVNGDVGLGDEEEDEGVEEEEKVVVPVREEVHELEEEQKEGSFEEPEEDKLNGEVAEEVGNGEELVL